VIDRRTFMAGIGTLATSPIVARAQKPNEIYRIGFLANDPTIPTQPAGEAFLEGLREGGFVEGRNIVIDRRFAEGRIDRYSVLAAELAALDPDIIVTSANAATLAAQRLDKNIPIVMMNVSDPVASGFVTGLAHPGGNITGLVQDESSQIAARRLQLLKDAIPLATRVAVLGGADTPVQPEYLKALEFAANALHISLQAVAVQNKGELESAFATLVAKPPDALFAMNGGFNFTNRRLIIELATKTRLPVISNFREFTEAGGLMSYGNSRPEEFRRAAIYVGQILKGAKPSDLPVEQPTKYDLVINLKTAKALNIEIPKSLLLVADDVIE
jgi:putative tryptophan/tyrosine transport system substrate-binding protein